MPVAEILKGGPPDPCFVFQAKKFAKFRERKSRVDKDVVRTDRTLPFYEGDDNPNVDILRNILITYSFYNFDLGYCQARENIS